MSDSETLSEKPVVVPASFIILARALLSGNPDARRTHTQTTPAREQQRALLKELWTELGEEVPGRLAAAMKTGAVGLTLFRLQVALAYDL